MRVHTFAAALVIDPSPQGAATLANRTEMAIAATLDYQACDDKVCFNPQSVALAWTIGIRPLDCERARQPGPNP